MKAILAAAMLSIGLYGSVEAADGDMGNCAVWNTQESYGKSSLILGWLIAIEAADTMTNDEIVSKLWPTGHRVGSVVLEVDAECRVKPAQTVKQSILNTARRLNNLK